MTAGEMSLAERRTSGGRTRLKRTNLDRRDDSNRVERTFELDPIRRVVVLAAWGRGLWEERSEQREYEL